MEELLVLLVQFFFEMLLNVLANLPFDALFRHPKTPDAQHAALKSIAWILLGALLGWLSTWIFPHTLISLPALRLLNVVISPVVAALLSQAVAARRSRANPNISPRHHFWYAFWFTLALVLVRLACAARA